MSAHMVKRPQPRTKGQYAHMTRRCMVWSFSSRIVYRWDTSHRISGISTNELLHSSGCTLSVAYRSYIDPRERTCCWVLLSIPVCWDLMIHTNGFQPCVVVRRKGTSPGFCVHEYAVEPMYGASGLGSMWRRCLKILRLRTRQGMWNIPLVAVCLQSLHTRKVRVVFYIEVMLAS
jgi:hypothetical protein